MVPALQRMVRTSDNLFGPVPRVVDAGGPGRARAEPGSRADEGSGSADAHPGDPRQRDAVQGRRSLAADDYRAATKDPDTDVVIQAMLTLAPVQGCRTDRHRQGGADGQPGPRRAGGRHADPPPAMVLTGGGGRGGTCRRTAGGAAARGDRLQRAVLHLSRSGRARHARRGRRRDDGAAAGRLAARAGPSRLRDQSDAARPDRADRRPDLLGRDGPDGHQPATSGLRRRPRTCAAASATPASSSRRGCRAGARRDRQSQDGRGRRRAGSVAAGALAAEGHVERDGQPQPARPRQAA